MAGDVVAGTVVVDGGDAVAVATGLGGAVVTLPGLGDAVAAGRAPRVTDDVDVRTDGSLRGAGCGPPWDASARGTITTAATITQAASAASGHQRRAPGGSSGPE